MPPPLSNAPPPDASPLPSARHSTVTPTAPAPRRRPWPWAVTQAGWTFLLLTLFVYLATVSSGANLLYFCFGLMVGAVVVSALVAQWSLAKLHFTRDFSAHVIAGEPAAVVYAVSSTKKYWPTMGLRFREVHAGLAQAPEGFILHLPAGPAGATPARVPVQLVAARRGNLKLDAIEVSTCFPFGFLRRTKRLHVPQEMLVYPRIGVLNHYLALEYRESVDAGAMTSNRRGGNDEFYGVREYRPGDNLRAIHWRSTARRGELMIREMAANAPPQLILVLNIRAWQRPGAGGQAAAERAIELAASLVCYGFLENFAVGLAIAGLPRSPTDGPLGRTPSPQMGRDARARLLRQLAMLDVPALRADQGIDFPNRVAGRAQWVVITLHRDDPIDDLLPPGWGGGRGAPAQPGAAGGGSGSPGHRTVLALDAPDAGSWIRFLSPEDTLHILRERGTNLRDIQSAVPVDRETTVQGNKGSEGPRGAAPSTPAPRPGGTSNG